MESFFFNQVYTKNDNLKCQNKKNRNLGKNLTGQEMIYSKKVEKYRRPRDIFVVQTCNKLLRVKNLILHDNTSSGFGLFKKEINFKKKCRTKCGR
jgi:hypothetical protein